MSEQSVIDVLSSGGQLWYQPLNDNLLLMDDNEYHKITIHEFLSLREAGQIVHTKSNRQGHLILRGRYDTYKLAESI